MIQHIVATKIPVIATLALIGDRLCSPEECDGDVMPMANHEWLIAEQSVEVLEIFDITNVIRAETKVTGSTVLLFYKKITYHLIALKKRQDLASEIKKIIESFQHLFKKRFESVKDHELLTQCTLLDLRFKKYGFLSESKYRNTVQELYTKI